MKKVLITLLSISIVFVFTSLLLFSDNGQAKVPEGTKIHGLINLERSKVGLKPLVYNTKLEASALDKCYDMLQKGYWSHDLPDGKDFSTVTDKYTKYKRAGENLAKDIYDSESVVSSWMSSKTHRDNITSSFTDQGIAVCSNETTVLVVQHFLE